jgi:8-oxo-dGTP pyrophosphatase MutT (NUDIX family)
VPEGEIRAAGGILWRSISGLPDDAVVEVALVHRPRYDDWSLPKGKAEDGESDEDCARREVVEETGLRCELGAELASTSYRDARGRRKRVRYWAMRPLNGRFEGRHEVDEVRWLPLDEAEEELTWSRDRTVLRSLEEVLA